MGLDVSVQMLPVNEAGEVVAAIEVLKCGVHTDCVLDTLHMHMHTTRHNTTQHDTTQHTHSLPTLPTIITTYIQPTWWLNMGKVDRVWGV